MRTHLLQRAVLSHLLVAVPPALILGLLVVDINERNLREDAQQLHLSVAGRLRDAVEAEVRLQQAILRHGERLLSAPTGTLEEKKALLRALVAAGQLPWIAIYAPDGRLDSVVRPTEGAPPPPELAEAVRVAARTKGFGVGAPTFEGGTAHVAMAVPLTVEDEVRGYVVSSLEVGALGPEVKSLRASFLGQQGKLQIVSAGGVHLLAAGGPAAGNPVGRDAPFFGMSADEVGALAAAETGVSTAWVDHGGGSWLASLVSAPSLGWVVGSARPESVALASIDAVRRRTLLLALIAGLAAGLVGLLFARAVAGPVRALARAVRASAQGGFGARVEAQGPAELEALGLAFNEALASLDQHKRELRHRTQLQVRLSRYLAPSALHELLSQDSLRSADAKEELVTVLYVDLSAGSDLSREVEEGRLVDLLEDLYAEACAAIEQHGGRVDRYSGDAVIGLFPASLVTDPPRAGRAAAEDVLRRMAGLRTRWAGQALRVSVGMVSQTGHIVTAGDTTELTVHGALVEQAAALQHGAPADSVAMDEATRRALSG